MKIFLKKITGKLLATVTVSVLLSVFVNCGMFTALADEHILFWMTDDPLIEGVNGAQSVYLHDLSGTIDGVTYTAGAARMAVIDVNTGEVTGYLQNLQMVGGSYVNVGEDWSTYVGFPDTHGIYKSGPSLAVVNDYYNSTTVKFMIEIYGFTDQEGYEDNMYMLASSQAFTYQELFQAGHIKINDMSIPEHGAWDGGSYAVPEPTSGLLVLIGGALLALRRRS